MVELKRVVREPATDEHGERIRRIKEPLRAEQWVERLASVLVGIPQRQMPIQKTFRKKLEDRVLPKGVVVLEARRSGEEGSQAEEKYADD